MRPEMRRLAEEIDVAANEIAAATLRDCTPADHHEAIAVGFKAGAAYILARLMKDQARRGGPSHG